MLKYERQQAKDAFVIGYLSERLNGTDGLSTDEWLTRAESAAEKVLPVEEYYCECPKCDAEFLGIPDETLCPGCGKEFAEPKQIDIQ